ncbi:uncharacterized protein AMSG_10767 [Thecamonas trahens ATCC 50062]|uniref:Pyrrolo-quinoline quinone repeat domain-containing protein n=1 Tax=Thecamonas trahens ATCC 50062 TaxID=461836 RepID=A0A0L0DUL0_THETB|nr:hypothetical protein AMSG_10767 [Thecamonas trahens ATCC 50062]KNC55158.1 hypothetical protein AMSG_10767 [Thecamonas trahens ATCC 50062]|eukprot:XP_013753213.1 hypothetical protein AMSG_10767 [Thecamonas trahens ATCC 50062]
MATDDDAELYPLLPLLPRAPLPAAPNSLVGGTVAWTTKLGVRFASPHVTTTKLGLYAAARRRVFHLDEDSGAVLSSVKICSASKIANVAACLHVDVTEGVGYYTSGKAAAKIRLDGELDEFGAVMWEVAVKKVSGMACVSLLDATRGVLYLSVSGSIYALSTATGAVLDANVFSMRCYDVFTLAIDDRGSLIAGERSNMFITPVNAAADAAVPARKISLSRAHAAVGLAAAPDMGLSHSLVAPDEVVWHNPLKGLRYGTGVSVAVAAKAGLVFVGIAGSVAALDAHTGETLWTTSVSSAWPLVVLHVDAAAEVLYAGALGTVVGLRFADGTRALAPTMVGGCWGYVTLATAGSSTSYSQSPMPSAFVKHHRRRRRR